MPKEIIISPKGELRAIYSPETDQILRGVAAKSGTQVETRRASHVEPTTELANAAIQWLAMNHAEFKDQSLPEGTTELPAAMSATDMIGALLRPHLPQDRWWADLLPVDGPVLGPFDTREIALDEEAKWLVAHNIPVCGPCRETTITGRFPSEPEFQPLKEPSRPAIPESIHTDFDYGEIESRIHVEMEQDPQDPLDDDRDPRNPVESANWDKIYARMDDFEDFLDHDHGMDG